MILVTLPVGPGTAFMLRTALPLAMLVSLAACENFETPLLSPDPDGALVRDVQGHLSIAPDGSRLGVAHPGGGVSVVDIPTGEVQRLDETATAIAVGRAHEEVWFASADGRILRQDSGAKPWIFAHPALSPGSDPECLPIDGLMVRGKVLAWSSSATGQGGLYDTENGQELLRLEDLSWVSHPSAKAPLIGLTGDGQSMVYRKRGALAQHDTITGLWSKAPFAPHPSSLDPMRAASGHWLYYVTREEGQYLIKGLATDGTTTEVVDAAARGGMISNLILSPNGRHLLEGSPLHPGARVYTMPDGAPAQYVDIAADQEQLTPVGFCVLDGAEHVLTRGSNERGVLTWEVNGKPLEGNPFPWLQGLFVSAAGPLPKFGAHWALVSELDGEGRPGSLDLMVMYDLRP